MDSMIAYGCALPTEHSTLTTMRLIYPNSYYINIIRQ